MNRSPVSPIPSAEGQPSVEKRDANALVRRQKGGTNARVATQVNAVTASSTPPTSMPIQLELFSGRACPLEAKAATHREDQAKHEPMSRDGVSGGDTRGKRIKTTGETRLSLTKSKATVSREAYKGKARKRRNDAPAGVGGGDSTEELVENTREGSTATSIKRTKKGKATGLSPRGKTPPQSAERMSSARKLQRTLYRVAKQQPHRRFTLLYDKICRADVLQEAWQRVKRNGGAAGVDAMTLDAVKEYGEARLLTELEQALREKTYRVSPVRRVYIPKPGQPGRQRPLGIPTVQDRVVQMATKIVIEPLFEADFLPCSYGFRPKRTPRMALSVIAEKTQMGYAHIVDVDLQSYFDTIDHTLLMRLVERRVGDKQVLRLIRAWLKAGILDEGKVTHPNRGTPQGGVISPLLSNIFLHEIDRQWQGQDSVAILVRYADDMVILTRTREHAEQVWQQLQTQFAQLHLTVNSEKSRLTTLTEGFAFLGFEFRQSAWRRLYMFPRAKACKHIRERVREVVRSIPSNEPLPEVVRKLNPVLIGWCTYFRVGNSNRAFHKIDRAVRDEVNIWLRRKHRCAWWEARKRWNYRVLHERYRLYRMVGKVSHLDGLRRK
ncbi:Group II intron-encoded protein LtrA [Anaerolineae bacterium]|nr:Group II intron-encoded protein LtrA [Anaerolineae bacterium]